MKKLLKTIVLCLLIMSLSQCEKELSSESDKINPMDDPMDDTVFKLSDYAEDSLAAIGYNEDMIDLNRKCLLIARSLYKAFESKDYNELIYDKYNLHLVKSIPFSILFEDKDFQSDINLRINSELNKSNLKSILNASTATEMYEKFFVSARKQEPILHLINPKVADFSLRPIISPGLEIEDDMKNNINDCIIAWFRDNSGDQLQIILSEEEALLSLHPVFVISTINKNEESIILEMNSRRLEVSSTNKNSITSKKSILSTTSYSTNEYRIDYRYENSGNSEFCINGARRTWNGTKYITYYLFDDNNDYSKEIASVDPDDIGDDLSHWEYFCADLDHDDNYFMFNTFERDWYAGTKVLIDGAEGPYGGTTYLYGNMGSSDNWYLFDPDTYGWDDKVDLDWFIYNWAKTYDEDKGKIRLWKTVN